MPQKIISIICVLVSLVMLCTIQFRKNFSILADFYAPAYCEANQTSIILSAPDASETDKFESDSKILSKSLHAAASCLMDTASGRILYSDNSDKRLPMASTTKIMTCIITLESGKLMENVTFSKYAASMPDVQLNAKTGEQYLLSDLLYSLMLESHNDTAAAIAEHIGGSVEGFAALMNNKAKELGCINTNFVTPNGLDADEHYTTAADLCTIASYAINNPEFCKIISTPSHSFSDTTGKRQFTVNNHDAFLNMYSGALGIKTGFTGKAGYCFVGAASQNGTTLVSSVLASGWPPHKSYKWSDTTALMNYGYNNYKSAVLLEGTYSSCNSNAQGTVILQPLSVQDGNGAADSTVKKLDISFQADCTMPMSPSDNAVCTLELPPFISAPVREGEIIGTAALCINGDMIYEYPVTADTDIPKISLNDISKLILNTFLL